MPSLDAGVFGLLAGPVLGSIMFIAVLFSGGGFPAAWRTCWIVCVALWVVAIVAIITGHFSPASHG